MAENKKVNQLNNLNAVPASDDKFVVWDESTGETKYVTMKKLVEEEFNTLQAEVDLNTLRLSEVGELNKAVSNAGDQTIDGVKTFLEPVVIPDAVEDDEAVSKGQMDTLDGTNVKLTGDQTVAGVKTFTSSPIVPTPTTGTQAVNKEYVDSLSNTSIQSNINCTHLPAYTSNQYVNSETFYSNSGDNLFQTNLLFPLTEVNVTNVTIGAGFPLNEINGVVEVGSYVYVHATQGTSGGRKRVLRYLKSDITASPTVMTIAGQTFGTTTNIRGMSYDGTYFLFPAKAFNSSNSYVMSRYSLSDTTLTYVDDINLGSTAIQRLFSFNNKYYTLDSSNVLKRYSITGTLEYTRIGSGGTQYPFIYDAEDYKYFFLSRNSQLVKYEQVSL